MIYCSMSVANMSRLQCLEMLTLYLLQSSSYLALVYQPNLQQQQVCCGVFYPVAQIHYSHSPYLE